MKLVPENAMIVLGGILNSDNCCGCPLKLPSSGGRQNWHLENYIERLFVGGNPPTLNIHIFLGG